MTYRPENITRRSAVCGFQRGRPSWIYEERSTENQLVRAQQFYDGCFMCAHTCCAHLPYATSRVCTFVLKYDLIFWNKQNRTKGPWCLWNSPWAQPLHTCTYPGAKISPSLSMCLFLSLVYTAQNVIHEFKALFTRPIKCIHCTCTCTCTCMYILYLHYFRQILRAMIVYLIIHCTCHVPHVTTFTQNKV